MKIVSQVVCLSGVLAVGCGKPIESPLVLADGLGARAVEIRTRIIEQAETICSKVGPSSKVLGIARTRVHLSEKGLSCFKLTTHAQSLGPLINPKSREETMAPVAEWVTILGSPAVPMLRRVLTEENVQESERHLAVWALMRIASERRPYPHGAGEAKCLLEQWRKENGSPLPGEATLESFEPWPSGTMLYSKGERIFGPDPRLPAPFNEPYDGADLSAPFFNKEGATRLDEGLSKELSETLRKIRAERSALIEEAWHRLDELRDDSVERSPEAFRRELGEAFAVIAVLRPEIRRLREQIEPWLDKGASQPYDEDPVMAVLEAYGVEALLLIHKQLISEDPQLRRKPRRLLEEIAGETGADCLLRSWARDLPEKYAERLLALRGASGAAP